MSKSAPYFPFYPDDWLESDAVADMGYECNGVYIKLLCLMWKRGGFIPDRADWCCRALWLKPAKWKKIRTVLIDDFSVIQTENGQLFNERITKELRLFNEKSQKSAEKANKRWSKVKQNNQKKANKINETSNAVAMQQQCHTDTDTDTDTEKSKSIGEKTKKRFSPPTQSEIIEYSVSKNLNTTGFFDYYESNGWLVGKNKMKDWKAAARNWSSRQLSFSGNNGQSKPSAERQKFVRKPSKDFIKQNPSLDENVLDGEFTRMQA